jgi:hypothetical protein
MSKQQARRMVKGAWHHPSRRGAAFCVPLTGTTYSCAAFLVRIALLAAAPLTVWQAPRRAISHGVARFLGRRGCGTRNSLLQVLGRRHASDTASPMQRPSDLGGGRLPLTSHSAESVRFRRLPWWLEVFDTQRDGDCN